MSGLTTSDQYGTAEPGRHHNRQDFQADSINAVVVRKRQGKDYGLGGKTVFLSHASVAQPLQPLFGVGVGFLCGSRPAEERVRVSVPEPAPNQALEPTPRSVRCAAASGRGSPRAFGIREN
jgi:hypothetical protein